MERCHEMPFGAQVLNDGSVRFQLWAPSAERVELRLATGTTLPMEAAGGGWYLLETRAAAHGSRYRLCIDGEHAVPDPASRYQPDGVEAHSEVVDPRSHVWSDGAWRGRRLEEAVFYEVHPGTFDPRGDFDGVRRRLDHLHDLGVTALELMPVAEGPGRWSWGYDGVLPFAPRCRYGGPAALKRLVEAAHERELMVFLDVVYNHFGPQGNHLPRYAPAFLSDRHETPWGAAINFDGDDCGPVRKFFIHNALYWLEEYHLDGLRLDAIHAIIDDSATHFVDALAQAVHSGPGQARHVHLILENDGNEARFLHRNARGRVDRCSAQWNDDLHHVLHVLLTGETGGYYRDYADDPTRHLLRCLAQGFAWQGQPSPFRGGRRRGEPSNDLPPSAFVAFLQNHDQIGNRAAGERVGALAPAAAVRAATALLLLAPFPPLLFMGQEWGATQPFPYFCDYDEPLASAVREGRRREFDHSDQQSLPDPCAQQTFEQAMLDWAQIDGGQAQEWLRLHRELLALRQRVLGPHLAGLRPLPGGFRRLGAGAIEATWGAGDLRLWLVANLSGEAIADVVPRPGHCWYATEAVPSGQVRMTLPPWSVYGYRSP